MHALSLGTVPRFMPCRIGSGLGLTGRRYTRDPGRRSSRPPARSSLDLGKSVMCTLSFGTALLEQLAVAVRAVQDRLRLEPDREEARTQYGKPEASP